MNFKPLVQVALAAGLAGLALHAMGQHTLEIIPLRHGTVDQVLPALQPLLEPGGTLSGHAGQLFVRTSPRNLAEIKQALAVIDRPRRRLQISVRFDDSGNSASQGVEAGGRISNRGTRIEMRGQSGESRAVERVDQRIQVLEGGRARILTGQATPMPERHVMRSPSGVVVEETTVLRETATGFEVVPRLAGNAVHLDIAPQKESLERQQRISTSVTARLGEWVEVGGTVAEAARAERGIASANRSASYESRRIWLKVEELP